MKKWQKSLTLIENGDECEQFSESFQRNFVKSLPVIDIISADKQLNTNALKLKKRTNQELVTLIRTL